MIYNLQLLRFLAAFAVLCAHLILFGIAKYGLDGTHLSDPAGFMMMGVDIFFILSGFIMVYTSSLDAPMHPRDAASKTLTFYIKRITRIYPIWWLLCLMLLPVLLFYSGWVNSSADAPPSFLHSFFLIPHETVPLIVVGWTLEFEMFFYLFFGLTLWLGRKMQVAILCLAAGACVLYGALNSIGHFAPIPDTAANPYLLILTSPFLLYFAAGMVIGLIYMRKTLQRYIMPLALIALPLTLAYTASHEYQSIDRIAHFMPLSINIFMIFLGLDVQKIIVFKSFCKWGGNISYALYLLHILVIAAAVRIYITFNLDTYFNYTVLALLITVGSLIGASMLYYFFEAPLLKALRERVKRRTGIEN